MPSHSTARISPSTLMPHNNENEPTWIFRLNNSTWQQGSESNLSIQIPFLPKLPTPKYKKYNHNLYAQCISMGLL